MQQEHRQQILCSRLVVCCIIPVIGLSASACVLHNVWADGPNRDCTCLESWLQQSFLAFHGAIIVLLEDAPLYFKFSYCRLFVYLNCIVLQVAPWYFKFSYFSLQVSCVFDWNCMLVVLCLRLLRLALILFQMLFTCCHYSLSICTTVMFACTLYYSNSFDMHM